MGKTKFKDAAHNVQSLISNPNGNGFRCSTMFLQIIIDANRAWKLKNTIVYPDRLQFGVPGDWYLYLVPGIVIALISTLMIMRFPNLFLLSETLWWTKRCSSGRDDGVSPPGQIKRIFVHPRSTFNATAHALFHNNNINVSTIFVIITCFIRWRFRVIVQLALSQLQRKRKGKRKRKKKMELDILLITLPQ